MFATPYVSCVTCPMSHVKCHMSHVTCGGASWLMVCYQRGLPRLVFTHFTDENDDYLLFHIFEDYTGQGTGQYTGLNL